MSETDEDITRNAHGVRTEVTERFEDWCWDAELQVRSADAARAVMREICKDAHFALIPQDAREVALVMSALDSNMWFEADFRSVLRTFAEGNWRTSEIDAVRNALREALALLEEMLP